MFGAAYFGKVYFGGVYFAPPAGDNEGGGSSSVDTVWTAVTVSTTTWTTVS